MKLAAALSILLALAGAWFARGGAREPALGMDSPVAREETGSWNQLDHTDTRRTRLASTPQAPCARVLRVLVVDVAGRPVERARVELCNEQDELLGGTARTDEQGIATFAHARPGDFTTSARVALLGAEATRVSFDLTQIPADPIRLALPAYGSACVRVVDAHDDPWPHDAAVFVRVDKDASAELAYRGVAKLVDWIAIGTQLSARATSAGQELSDAAAPGPRRNGEQVELTVRIAPHLAVLRGRLRDTEGEALWRAAIRVGWRNENGSSERTVRTSDEGSFALVLDPTYAGPSTDGIVIRRDLRPRAIARLQRTISLAPGVHELGEIAFEEMPVLATGEIVDSAGAPITGSTCEVSGAYPVQVLMKRHAFEVLGWSDFGHVAITPAHDWFLKPAPIEVRAGTCGLRCVLERGGTLRVSVLMPPDVDRGVEVTLQPSGHEELPAQGQDSGEDGSTNRVREFRGLAIGSYELYVRSQLDAKPLLAPQRIEIGARGADEVRTIDLRAFARTIK